MLDLKFVRSNPQKVQEALASRGAKVSLTEFLQLEEQRRVLVVAQVNVRGGRLQHFLHVRGGLAGESPTQEDPPAAKCSASTG